MMRAVASVPPPAPHGTMSWTGRCGYWAFAVAAAKSKAAIRPLIMDAPPRLSDNHSNHGPGVKLAVPWRLYERTRPGRAPGPFAERPEALPHPVLPRRPVGWRLEGHPGGEPGHRLDARHGTAARRRGGAARDRRRGTRLAGVAREDRQRARRHPAQMVRPHDGEPGGSCPDPDRRAGQAVGGSAR